MIARMTSRHQFHLRWSNYGQNLANSFIRLFESESLSDVTLFCEGESYRAHRVVLAASSVHFQELFEQCSTAQNLVVILDGTSPSNLRALLEFMYKGEVYIDDAHLNTFLQTAKRLQVKGLSLSQNDLQTISSDVGEDRTDGSSSGGGAGGKGGPGGSFSTGSGGSSYTLLAQALGPLLIPHSQAQSQQQQQQQQPPSSHHPLPPLQNKNTNSVQSPPTSFSSPSPSQTPPNSLNTCGIYGDEKIRKKNRLPSPRHQSPNGMTEGLEYTGLHHPQRPAAPIPAPSPTMNPRIMEMDQRERQSMVPGSFASFSPHYSPSCSVPMPMPSSVPPPVPLQQSQQTHQQQQIVITENPNMRKIRSASTENTMPEDLSIKLEVGREDEGTIGMSGKQRSFSMDLSPSEPQGFGSHGGPGGPQHIWSLPSPSSMSSQQIGPQHDISLTAAQTSADGKKLKCPFCERLYGYETNLRAHIRQRHQGIRVPCPFCTRTFTRNNTVRRHVAREHRNLLGGVGVGAGVGVGVRTFPHMPQQQQQQDPGGPQFGSPSGGGNSSTNSSPTGPSQSPSTATSTSSSIGNGGHSHGQPHGGHMGGPNMGPMSMTMSAHSPPSMMGGPGTSGGPNRPNSRGGNNNAGGPMKPMD